MPLARLESLDLINRSLGFLPQLFEPAAAAALTALRVLMLSSWAEEEPRQLQPAVWRAPWLAQLTRLDAAGDGAFCDNICSALAPGSLPALRQVKLHASSGLRPAAFKALLAACNPAALESVNVWGAESADVARFAERLPALAALDVTFRAIPAGAGAAAAYEALQSARLAPLTRLSLSADDWLFDHPARLAALLSAPWAAPLRELGLHCAPMMDSSHLRSLRALSQLRHLRKLHMVTPRLEAAALRQAAAEGSLAASWAPRLAELQIFELWGFTADESADALRELLRLPLISRIEHLAFDAAARDSSEEEEFMRALPNLKKLTLS